MIHICKCLQNANIIKKSGEIPRLSCLFTFLNDRNVKYKFIVFFNIRFQTPRFSLLKI